MPELPVDWVTLKFPPDVTNFGDNNDFGSAGDQSLLFVRRTCQYDKSVAAVFTTAAAMVSAYLFAVGVYGGTIL
jgi:hypothetical protein